MTIFLHIFEGQCACFCVPSPLHCLQPRAALDLLAIGQEQVVQRARRPVNKPAHLKDVEKFQHPSVNALCGDGEALGNEWDVEFHPVEAAECRCVVERLEERLDPPANFEPVVRVDEVVRPLYVAAGVVHAGHSDPVPCGMEALCLNVKAEHLVYVTPKTL